MKLLFKKKYSLYSFKLEVETNERDMNVNNQEKRGEKMKEIQLQIASIGQEKKEEYVKYVGKKVRRMSTYQ